MSFHSAYEPWRNVFLDFAAFLETFAFLFVTEIFNGRGASCDPPLPSVASGEHGLDNSIVESS